MKKKKIRVIAIVVLLMLIFSICFSTINLAKEEISTNANTSSNHTDETTINQTEKQEVEEEQEETEEIEEEIPEDILEEDIPEQENVIDNKEEVVEEQEELPQEIEEISSEVRGVQTLKDGTYTIKSKVNEQKVWQVEENAIENGKKIKLADKLTISMSQNIIVKYLNNGCYSLTFENSNKALDVPGASKEKGTILQQYTKNGSEAQQWILEKDAQGYYSIQSKANRLYVDIPSGKAVTGSNLQLYTGNHTEAQKFIFEKVDPIKAEKTIPEGIYYIASALSDQKVLTIADGKTTNTANVQIEDKGRQYQKFALSYNENLKAYTIKAFHSDKVLDVAGGGQANFSNVQQYESNQTKAQQWIIQKTEDGYYSIISKCNYLFLDLGGGSTKNGTNVQVYEPNQTKAQKFSFEKIEPIKAEPLLENGVYKIESALNNRKVLDIANGSNANGANLQIWDWDAVQQQKFQITYQTSGKYYEIKPIHSLKSLDVAGAAKVDGTNVSQYQTNGSEAQKWALKDAGNGYFYIIAMHSGLYLDIAGASTACGTNIQVFTGNGSKAQKFKFVKTKVIEEGNYQIVIRSHERKALDIAGKSFGEGANLQIWDKENVSQQIFNVKAINETDYKMIAKHSKKVLTVDGNNVVQMTDANREEQIWNFESVGDNFYKIKSKATGLCMDVVGNQTANETNVQVYQENHTVAQLFKLEKVTEKNGIDVSFYQKNIDWKKVSQTEYADFAMIRAGFRGYGVAGTLNTDVEFVNNIKGATVNNVPIGLYFFTQAINVEEAIQEAHYVLNLANLAKSLGAKITYPIAIDTETANGGAGRADQLDVATRTAVCKAFCDTIRSAGYTPAIYASRDWFYHNLDFNQLRGYDIWVAHYTGNVANKTNFKYDYDMWQYTSSGSVNGINGNVDLNISYKNY